MDTDTGVSVTVEPEESKRQAQSGAGMKRNEDGCQLHSTVGWLNQAWLGSNIINCGANHV